MSPAFLACRTGTIFSRFSGEHEADVERWGRSGKITPVHALLFFRAFTEKTADISRRHHWFPRERTSEKRAQKFHTDDAILTRSRYCLWLVVPGGKFASANQKYYPGLGSDTSSVWNFRARLSDVILRGKKWWRREMSVVLSGYDFPHRACLALHVRFVLAWKTRKKCASSAG